MLADNGLELPDIPRASFHSVQHAVAVGTDSHQVFESRLHAIPQFPERDDVVRLGSANVRPLQYVQTDSG